MLQETKCDRVMMNKIAKNIWKNYEVECIEASRGILEGWKSSGIQGIMEVEVTLYLPRILMVWF
jgi:hypothetical protein